MHQLRRHGALTGVKWGLRRWAGRKCWACAPASSAWCIDGREVVVEAMGRQSAPLQHHLLLLTARPLIHGGSAASLNCCQKAKDRRFSVVHVETRTQCESFALFVASNTSSTTSYVVYRTLIAAHHVPIFRPTFPSEGGLLLVFFESSGHIPGFQL